MATPNGFIDEQEEAHELKVTLRTLRRWRAAGYGPPFTRVGRSIYYAENAAPNWLAGLEKSTALPEPRRRRAA